MCNSKINQCSSILPEHRANTKITPFLYGVQYDGYDFEACKEYFKQQIYPRRNSELSALCTHVRKGNQVGRNLDFAISGNATAIIRVNNKNDDPKLRVRHSSIGVAGCATQEFSWKLASSGEYNEIYQTLPCRTTDGINDCGVYIGVNLVPTGETSFNKDDWESDKWKNGATFTHATKEHPEELCTIYLVRYVLDNAESAKHALQLLQEASWYDPMFDAIVGTGQSYHWMISDDKDNYIVEFIDNTLCYRHSCEKGLQAPSLDTIMTNFNNIIYAEKDGGVSLVQDHGCGYERFNRLMEEYRNTQMENLMESVHYSKTYMEAPTVHNFFASEYSENVAIGKLYPVFYKKDPDFQAAYLDQSVRYRLWLNLKPEERYQDQNKNPQDQLWITNHTCIYDLLPKDGEQGSFKILMHEGMDSGEEGYRTFDFKNTACFEKPLEMKK